MPGGISDFMLGLLGAGKALSSGVETYEKIKSRQAKEKTDAAYAKEAEARADYYKRTDPNHPRGSYKDQSLTTLRSVYDAYLNRSKALPLNPEEKSEFDAIGLELNSRLGITLPKPSAPAQQSAGGSFMPRSFSDLFKFLTGRGETPKTDKPSWQKYDDQ